MMIGVPQIPTNHYSAAEVPPPEENPHVDYSFLDLMLGPDDQYDCPVKHEPVHSDLILANDTEPLEIDVTLRSLVTAQNFNGFLEEQLELVRSQLLEADAETERWRALACTWERRMNASALLA
jgi:hypothetical protein